VSLDPRAIALQGVGYTAFVLALQGLVPTAESPVIHSGGGIWRPRPQPVAGMSGDEIRRQNQQLLLILSTALQVMNA
jgi:hypothetical protein